MCIPLFCAQVEIEVETCDKGGTFLGTIVLPGPKPVNLGITLARMGLAKTQQFFAADRWVMLHVQGYQMSLQRCVSVAQRRRYQQNSMTHLILCIHTPIMSFELVCAGGAQHV